MKAWLVFSPALTLQASIIDLWEWALKECLPKRRAAFKSTQTGCNSIASGGSYLILPEKN